MSDLWGTQFSVGINIRKGEAVQCPTTCILAVSCLFEHLVLLLLLLDHQKAQKNGSPEIGPNTSPDPGSRLAHFFLQHLSSFEAAGGIPDPIHPTAANTGA